MTGMSPSVGPCSIRPLWTTMLVGMQWQLCGLLGASLGSCIQLWTSPYLSVGRESFTNSSVIFLSAETSLFSWIHQWDCSGCLHNLSSIHLLGLHCALLCSHLLYCAEDPINRGPDQSLCHLLTTPVCSHLLPLHCRLWVSAPPFQLPISYGSHVLHILYGDTTNTQSSYLQFTEWSHEGSSEEGAIKRRIAQRKMYLKAIFKFWITIKIKGTVITFIL